MVLGILHALAAVGRLQLVVRILVAGQLRKTGR
jgi:hypothetical protein